MSMRRTSWLKMMLSGWKKLKSQQSRKRSRNGGQPYVAEIKEGQGVPVGCRSCSKCHHQTWLECSHHWCPWDLPNHMDLPTNPPWNMLSLLKIGHLKANCLELAKLYPFVVVGGIITCDCTHSQYGSMRLEY